MEIDFLKRVEEINALNEELRHREYLKLFADKGLRYTIMFNAKPENEWMNNYTDSKYEPRINLIERLENVLVVEFDEPEGEGLKPSEALEETEKRVKKEGFAYMRSTHKGKSDYLWLEFAKPVSEEEGERFLKWICPKNARIDTNFSSSVRVFPVLFAYHRKHSANKETPLYFRKGNKVDLSKLEIPKYERVKKGRHIYDTFENNTFENVINPEAILLKDFLKGKPEKEKPLIKGFIPEKSLIIIWGEPTSCKSIFVNYLGCCLASGKKFLGNYITKKLPVLILSSENQERTDKSRFYALLKGLKIVSERRKAENLSFFYCGRNKISNLNSEKYYNQLKETISDKKIKLLIIDTISPLILDKNDNIANEMVDVFKNRLFPLIDEFRLSIILTMHSQKTGKDFLGSIKIKASSDCFYELRRAENELNLLCEKNREGERNLKMVVDFINKKDKKELLDKITFTFLEEFKGKQSGKSKGFDTSKLKACEEIIINSLKDGKMGYNEMVKACKSAGQTDATAKRAINTLFDSGKIGKEHTEKRGYYLNDT